MKYMDKEAIKHVIKTRYLNSYKVIVAGGRDYIYNYKGTWTNHGGYHKRHEGLPLPIGASCMGIDVTKVTFLSHILSFFIDKMCFYGLI